MCLYAYCRVSTERQSLKRQMENIMSADDGAYRNAKFFSDRFTGSTLDRPEWNRLYKRLHLRFRQPAEQGRGRRSCALSGAL